MNRRLPLSEVEARVRATLLARSEDSMETGLASSGEDPTGGAMPVGPVWRPRRRSRLMVATVAAGVLVVAGFVARQAADDPTTGADDVAAADPGRPDEVETGTGVVQETCGPELPVTFRVPEAISGPISGPAPGGEPAAPGQLVLHWTRSEGTIEARWPAGPQPLYDLDGNVGGPADASIGGMSTMSTDPARVEVFMTPSGGVRSPDTSRPDFVVEGRTEQSPPCDVIEVVLASDAGRIPFWLTLHPDPTAPTDDVPFGSVDRHPLVVERRQVDEAPDTAIPCGGDGVTEPPANRHGGPDTSLRGDEPAQVLQAFVAAQAGGPDSGFVEMTEPDGSITYGHDPAGQGWTVLASVTQEESGWYLERWTTSGC